VTGTLQAAAPLEIEPAAGLSPTLELDLDVFDGPFDLLVTLILKDEIDIWEVRVSRIIAEYVLRLAESGEFDLDATSQFVVLVAALLEMKSRLLLEQEIEGDELDELDPDEAARRLVERLVRYGQFRNAADHLGERWGVHAGRLYRAAPVPPALLRRPAGDIVLPASRLAAALQPLLEEPPVPDTSHLADLAVSLIDELRRLRGLLDDAGSFSFTEVAPPSRLERALTFFALLELHAQGEVRLRQRRAFEDILVTRCPAAPATA
jgi:segregation and condensation protein A